MELWVENGVKEVASICYKLSQNLCGETEENHDEYRVRVAELRTEVWNQDTPNRKQEAGHYFGTFSWLVSSLMLKKKVKSLCLTKHHAMKTYWGVEV